MIYRSKKWTWVVKILHLTKVSISKIYDIIKLMKKTIIFLLLVIFIGNFLFSFSVSAIRSYDGYDKEVFYQGLVPCGKSEAAPANGDEPAESPEVKNPCQFCHLFVMLDGIIDFVLLDILPWVVVLMILIAGIMFYFAGGNPSLLLQAKKLITSVVIGLIIILCAYLIIGTILTVLGVQDWTTLDKWAGEGSFQVICPIGEDGNGGTGDTGDTGDIGDTGNSGKPVEDDNDVCIGIKDTSTCDEDNEKVDKGECIPGENTHIKVDESGMTDDGKGWTCVFQGDIVDPDLPYICYPPIGVIYLDCAVDPNYKGITCPENLENHPHLNDGYLLVRLLRKENGSYPAERCPDGYDQSQFQECDNAQSIDGICSYDDFIDEWPHTDMTCCKKVSLADNGQEATIKKLEDVGVEVNNPCPNENCNDSIVDCGEGADENTSVCVDGLPDNIIAKLGDIKKVCNDDVVITGGTETFGHDFFTPHGYGEAVVDLRKTSGLVAWLKENSVPGGDSWCNDYGTGYALKDESAWFCDEGDHFHFELLP